MSQIVDLDAVASIVERMEAVLNLTNVHSTAIKAVQWPDGRLCVSRLEMASLLSGSDKTFELLMVMYPNVLMFSKEFPCAEKS